MISQLSQWNTWDYISFSEVLFILIVPIYQYIQTLDPVHLVAFFGVQITNIAVEGLKAFVFPTYSRPRGAKRCDLLNTCPNDNGKPGMPSGHSAAIAFYGVFYKISNPLFLVYVALIAASRYFKKCHSIPQIIVGLLFGATLGYLARRIWLNMRVE